MPSLPMAIFYFPNNDQWYIGMQNLSPTTQRSSWRRSFRFSMDSLRHAEVTAPGSISHWRIFPLSLSSPAPRWVIAVANLSQILRMKIFHRDAGRVSNWWIYPRWDIWAHGWPNAKREMPGNEETNGKGTEAFVQILRSKMSAWCLQFLVLQLL